MGIFLSLTFTLKLRIINYRRDPQRERNCESSNSNGRRAMWVGRQWKAALHAAGESRRETGWMFRRSKLSSAVGSGSTAFTPRFPLKRIESLRLRPGAPRKHVCPQNAVVIHAHLGCEFRFDSFRLATCHCHPPQPIMFEFTAIGSRWA